MIRRENVRMYEFTESISAIRNREGEIKRLNSVSQVGINVREISGSNKINIQSHLSAETLFKVQKSHHLLILKDSVITLIFLLVRFFG